MKILISVFFTFFDFSSYLTNSEGNVGGLFFKVKRHGNITIAKYNNTLLSLFTRSLPYYIDSSDPSYLYPANINLPGIIKVSTLEKRFNTFITVIMIGLDSG